MNPAFRLLRLAIIVPMLAHALSASAQFVSLAHTAQGLPYINVPGSVLAIYEATSPDVAYGFATKVKRTSGGPGQVTVGGQFNGWSDAGVSSPTWGAAIEAIGLPGSQSVLVGTETLVGNLDPANLQNKIGNNVVFMNRLADGEPSATRNNDNSIAYWVTATPGTGFETALKLHKDSIADSATRKAAVIDLADLEDLDVIVFRLPQGKAITLRMLMELAR
jgi:hypothetical protein